MASKKQGVAYKLRNKYRLIIYNDDTFEEILTYRLNRLNVFTLVGTMITISCTALYLLIAYTPLKIYVIPDFPKAEERRAIMENRHRVDSLENQLRLYNQYLVNMQKILRGEDTATLYAQKEDTAKTMGQLELSRSKEDSLFRRHVEEEESYSLTFVESQKQQGQLTALDFFTPVKGLVTSSFDKSKGHTATDVVTSPDAPIHSVLDGVVVFADWTIETGFVIHVQHDHGLLSVYKHCSRLLKKLGDNVSAGDAIAIVGNTGTMTTGPHLHFELWQKGQPRNAEEFINFQ